MEDFDGPTNLDENDDDSTQMEDKDILSLLSELRAEASTDDPFRDNGRLIERLVLNKPITGLINHDTFLSQYEESSSSMQLLFNQILTYSNVLTKDRPQAYGVASHNDDFDSVSAAEIATKVLEYVELEESMAEKWSESSKYSAMHGTGIIKTIYNPATDRIEKTPLSIFDCFIENAATKAQAGWCLIRTHLSERAAYNLIKSAKGDDARKPQATQYEDGAGVTRKGVEKWEIWSLPGSHFKNGLVAIIVGDVVIEQMEYPYVFEEVDGKGFKAMLPISYFRCRKVRGATLGTTWAQDCSSIQVTINKLFSTITENAVNSRQILVLPDSIRGKDLLDAQNARLYLPEADMRSADNIKYLNPGAVDPQVQTALEYNVDSMYKTSGISREMSGDSSQSTSGREFAYATERNASIHSDAAKDFEQAILNDGELTLKLMQKFYTTTKQVAIAGKDVLSFSGADLAGVTVQLQPRSANDGMQANKVAKANEQVAAGLQDPATLSQISPTTQSASLRLMAKHLLDRLLAGEDVSITPESVAPEAILAEIDERINFFVLRRDKTKVDQLKAFKDELLLMLNSSQTGDSNPAQTSEPTMAPIPAESIASESLPPL
jgi:hypothetical protein